MECSGPTFGRTKNPRLYSAGWADCGPSGGCGEQDLSAAIRDCWRNPAAGQGKEAAAEFQKILDHSGIVWNCWTGALAHLGVARANALQSRTSQGADADAARVRALAAYKDFLALWKDADPDIPILKQAKTEYAKLQ